MKKSILIACLGLVSLGLQAQSISLAGEWNVELGKSGSAFAKSKRASQGEMKRAILPGTIDTNHLGFAPKDTMETTHLTRLYAYKGAARYSRTINIPKDWKKKPVELFLERTRPTWVYVDGELVDSCNFISTPQRYLLPKKVKPGKHLLEIVVDNGRGVPDQVYGSSHAYTEDTQTNWNGIIGEIRLEVKSEERGVKKQRSASEGKANSIAQRRKPNSTFNIQHSTLQSRISAMRFAPRNRFLTPNLSRSAITRFTSRNTVFSPI